MFKVSKLFLCVCEREIIPSAAMVKLACEIPVMIHILKQFCVLSWNYMFLLLRRKFEVIFSHIYLLWSDLVVVVTLFFKFG